MATGDVRGRGPSGARAVLTAAVAALVAALLAVGGVWASPAQAALPAGSTVNGVVAFYGVTVVPTPGGRRALDLLAAAAATGKGVDDHSMSKGKGGSRNGSAAAHEPYLGNKDAQL